MKQIVFSNNSFNYILDYKYNITMNFKVDTKIIFSPGDFIRFVGTNGTGKTTLFRYLDHQYRESLINREHNPFNKELNLYYVPQNYEERIYSGRSVDSFLFKYIENKLFINNDSLEVLIIDFLVKYEFDKLLENNYPVYKKGIKQEFNIKLFKKMKVGNMSGGQKRLLYIFREILLIYLTPLNDKENILLLDEPFNDLDEYNKRFANKLIDIIRKTNPNIIIFIITHTPIVNNLNKVIELTNIKDNDIEIKYCTDNKEKYIKTCTCI